MRDPADAMADALGRIRIEKEIGEVHRYLEDHASGRLKDVPLPYLNPLARLASAMHEAGHAEYALYAGSTLLELKINLCSCSAIAGIRQKVLYALVGAAAEIRHYPPALGKYQRPTFDFVQAKSLIDLHNTAQSWPPLSYVQCARDACSFVDRHWGAIRQIGLALSDAGELTDHSARIYSRCKYYE